MGKRKLDDDDLDKIDNQDSNDDYQSDDEFISPDILISKFIDLIPIYDHLSIVFRSI